MAKSNKELAVQLTIALLSNDAIPLISTSTDEDGTEILEIDTVLSLAYNAIKKLPDD